MVMSESDRTGTDALAKVRAYLCRLAKAVTKTLPGKFSYQVVRRDRDDGSIEYQIFADTPKGTQIAWVQSTRHDADFIAACLAQAPLFDSLLAAPDLATDAIKNCGCGDPSLCLEAVPGEACRAETSVFSRLNAQIDLMERGPCVSFDWKYLRSLIGEHADDLASLEARWREKADIARRSKRAMMPLKGKTVAEVITYIFEECADDLAALRIATHEGHETTTPRHAAED